MELPKSVGLPRLRISSLRKTSSQLAPRDVEKSLHYIRDYWPTLVKHNLSDAGTLVGLPHPYVVPAYDPKADFHFEEQYYWDSFFTALGLADHEHQQLVEGMLENLLHMYRRFSLIPNASRMYFTGRSQPPLLTSFIFLVYDTYAKDSAWLRQRIAVAQDEYQTVWLSKTHPHWHNVHRGLSRYYDINMLHDLAEAESGWDMTPRFERKCLDFLPVDLNALLYKYETDFVRAAEILNEPKEAAAWKHKAVSRKKAMNDLMWGKLRGFYFDYNFERRVLGDIWSLAGYYPLWAGMADEAQVRKLVDNLVKFEKRGGLSTTARPFIDTAAMFGSIKAQWAYPNGWSPLHYMVIEGLERYGYHADAKRIALKWIKTNLDWYSRHGEFLEKYNVVNPKKPPVEGLYPSQSGFGWTNGVYVRLCQQYLFDDKQ